MYPRCSVQETVPDERYSVWSMDDEPVGDLKNENGYCD